MIAHVLEVVKTADAVRSNDASAKFVIIGRTGAASGLERVEAQMVFDHPSRRWKAKKTDTSEVFRFWARQPVGIERYTSGYIAMAPPGAGHEYSLELAAGRAFGDCRIFSTSANASPVGRSEQPHPWLGKGGAKLLLGGCVLASRASLHHLGGVDVAARLSAADTDFGHTWRTEESLFFTWHGFSQAQAWETHTLAQTVGRQLHGFGGEPRREGG